MTLGLAAAIGALFNLSCWKRWRHFAGLRFNLAALCSCLLLRGVSSMKPQLERSGLIKLNTNNGKLCQTSIPCFHRDEACSATHPNRTYDLIA